MLWVFFFLATITLWTTQLWFKCVLLQCKLPMRKEKKRQLFFLSVVSNQWYAKAHTCKLKYGCVSPVISTWIHKTMSFTWWKYGTHKRNRMRRLNALRENHFNWILKGKRDGVWNSLLAYVQHRGASILSDMNMRCDEYWTKFQLRTILWQDFFYKKMWNMRQSQATFFVIEKRIGRKKNVL